MTASIKATVYTYTHLAAAFRAAKRVGNLVVHTLAFVGTVCGCRPLELGTTDRNVAART